MRRFQMVLVFAWVLILATSALADEVFFEDFSGGAGAFSGFGSGCSWHTPGTDSDTTGYFGNGQFAEILKAGCGLPVFNAQIVSTSIDLSGHENAELSFKEYIKTNGISQGAVGVSTDGGSSWSNVFTAPATDTGSTKTVDLSAFDGESNVKVRFYLSYFGGIAAAKWGVDNVKVTADPVSSDDDTSDDDTSDDDTSDDDTSDDDTSDDDTSDDDTSDDDTSDDDTSDDDTSDDDTSDDDTGDDDTSDDDTGDDDTSDDDTGDDDDNDIAYVYSYTVIRAEDYQAFLTLAGYDVQLISLDQLDESPDLANVDVFIVDPDTSADWTPTRAAAIVDTGAPIIGDGDGLEVLDDTDLYMGQDNFIGVNNQDSLRPMHLGHPLWNTPNDLALTPEQLNLQVLQTPATIRALEDDGSEPLGVQFLGSSPDHPEYWGLAVENVQYAVWGFGVFGPSLYTDDGKDLFINLIEYVKSTPKAIGYVYDTDDTDALVFETMLESVGFPVTLFDVSDLDSRGIPADVDLFIVDNNAGADSWQAVTANALIDTGKPIIANNDGVHVFDFSDSYLSTDSTLTMDPASTFTPVSLSHPIWNEPYAEGFDGSPVMALNAAAAYRGLHDDGLNGNSVEFLGRDDVFLSYYPIAIEKRHHALWGFGVVPPSSYTETTREVFYNMIEYMTESEPGDDDDTSDDDTGDDDTGDDDNGDDDTDDDDDAVGDDDANNDDGSSGGCGC